MKRLVRSVLALAGISLATIAGCAHEGGGAGSACNTLGSTSECESGFVCADSGGGALACRQECTLETNCDAVAHCAVVGAGNGLKVCQPK